MDPCELSMTRLQVSPELPSLLACALGSPADVLPECTHCTEMGLQCTYLQEASRKGPPRGYVVTLQERCARLENLVQQVSVKSTAAAAAAA